LWAVIGLISLPLLFVELEASTSAIFILRKIDKQGLKLPFSREPSLPHVACRVGADFHHLRAPRQLEDLLLPVKDLLDVARTTTTG
jgi:hypothetical protein